MPGYLSKKQSRRAGVVAGDPDDSLVAEPIVRQMTMRRPKRSFVLTTVGGWKQRRRPSRSRCWITPQAVMPAAWLLRATSGSSPHAGIGSDASSPRVLGAFRGLASAWPRLLPSDRRAGLSASADMCVDGRIGARPLSAMLASDSKVARGSSARTWDDLLAEPSRPPSSASHSADWRSCAASRPGARRMLGPV